MILNVFSIGSAAPHAIALAAERHGGCVFVVEPDDSAAILLLPVLGELGDVIVARDVAGCVSGLRGRRPEGVVTFADRGIRLASGLARHFGLPGLEEKAAEWLSDKVAQRERLNATGVCEVGAAPLTGGVPPAGLRPPVVVKPREGAGSEDTVIIRTDEELRSLMPQLTEGRSYIVEEYIEGVDTRFGPWLVDLVSVESAVDVHGSVGHIGVSLRLPLARPARETAFVFPGRPPSDLAEAVTGLAEAAIAAVGFTCGVTHTEFKIGPAGPVVIEINGRLAGGHQRLMPRVGAVEPVALALALATGESLPGGFPEPTGHAMHYYAQPPYGAVGIRALPYPRTLRALPGVFAVEQHARPGTPVHWRQGSSGRVFDIYLAADTLMELARRKAALDEVLERGIEWEFA